MASASGGSFDPLQSRKRRKKKKGGQSQSKELDSGTSTANKTSISEEIVSCTLFLSTVVTVESIY